MSDDYDYRHWPEFGRILNNTVVPCTMMEWAEFFESQRLVASDHIEGAHVSTIFIGLNHGFGGRPLWFETMVFSLTMHDRKTELQWRYETLAEAKEGHARAIAWVHEHIEVMRAERRDEITSEVPEAPAPHKEE